jgi:hypothetical protein
VKKQLFPLGNFTFSRKVFMILRMDYYDSRKQK